MTDALFTAAQLSNTLPEAVSADQAAVAEQIVWGWITDVTDLTVRPDPVPADLFAWALELGGIAARNNLSRKQVGQVSYEYTEDGPRREEILAKISSAGDVGGARKGAPQGCFPPAQCYPDPILVAPLQPFSQSTAQAALDWLNNQ